MNQPDDEIYFAVSDDFYDAEDRLRYDDIYPLYRQYCEKCACRLSDVLGAATFAGSCRDPSYPEWAIGEHIHVWKYKDRVIWLRLHHEDRECPILVALSNSVA